jgi:hypothetical protein
LNQANQKKRQEKEMNEFLMIGLTVASWLIARRLWKVDQVFSISTLLAGIIILIWEFTSASAMTQLLIAGLLFGSYQVYCSKALGSLQLQMRAQKG